MQDAIGIELCAVATHLHAHSKHAQQGQVAHSLWKNEQPRVCLAI
jgi:hypothetical protein